MSLYNKASLIQVPSLYKDGTLVSTIPEDRSGDFTVARGSNLAATRVGEDGYIKKGYENLLLQSNQFDTTWSILNASVTSGQSGYDGSSDAWKFVADSTGFFRRITQSTNKNSIVTSSVYAKAGTADYIYMVHSSGSYSFGGYQFFDLTNGTLGASSFLKIIDASIEDVGNGWYRCTLVSEPDSQGQSFFGLSDANNNTNATSGNYIYIQDAQLNQGLVAYPYLETTTAPVQGGLLENSPRLDWSNGVPAVKLEEQRTNLIKYSELINPTISGLSWAQVASNTFTSNYGISPDGTQTSTRVQFVNANSSSQLLAYFTSAAAEYTSSVYLKGSGILSFGFYDNTNVLTEAITLTSEWKRFDVTKTLLATSNARFWIYPNGAGSSQDFEIWGAQCEQASTPSSYIPTYGTSQTRSNEVISDNFDIPTTATIYNSFYSDTAETVFVLDQVFNVAEGLNKVAIAFSPTAVKISVGGSIVANATGTYDTTALSNIQLGSNNGTDYSNAPISGFYVFPEFLTDEELNSLTD